MLTRGWGNATATALMTVAIASATALADPPAATLNNVSLRVDSVVASDTHQGVDPSLTTMGPRLQSVFSYSTYHLVSHKDAQTTMGTLVSFDLPGGRVLHIQPHQINGDMIEMDVVLSQGERPMMTTDLKLRNHGVLIVGGPKYQQGMLIISIGADCPGPRVTSAEASATTAQPPPAPSVPAVPSAQQ
jgi:hypothetical protein